MSHFNLKTGARWMSASALCSLFALSMGSASAQNDFQQVVITTTSGNKAFLDVDGKRLQQSIDSLFKWVDDLETLTSTPADPDTVYNYLNTLTVQQGGFQAFSTEGGMMGITDIDMNGTPMPVTFGAAQANIEASFANLQVGVSNVGWNSLDLDLVGGNNPLGASPELILEAFFSGDEGTDAGNVRAFLDSAEVGQFAFSTELEGTIEGDQILWAQDSLLFLGKNIVHEAAEDFRVSAGTSSSFIEVSDYPSGTYWYGYPDQAGQIFLEGEGGVALSVDGGFGGLEMAYDINTDRINSNMWAHKMDFYSDVNMQLKSWGGDVTLDAADGQLNLKAAELIESTSTHNHIQVTGDAGIDANDNLFLNGYGGVNMYSFDRIHSEVSDDGDAPAYLDIAWANSTDPWLYGGPDQNGHIVMNASGGMNLTVDQKAGMEVVSYDGGANMDVYSNSLDIYSVNPSAGTRWASVEMGYNSISGRAFMDLESDGDVTLESGEDISVISGNDLFVNTQGSGFVSTLGSYKVYSEGDISNTAMDGGLKVELADYSGDDFAEGDGYWHYSDPNEDYWDNTMPVIYMNSSDDISIYSENTGGLEICRDCGTVSLFANTGDMNVDAVDGQLNIKAGGMIESRSMHNSVVVTGDAGIDAGDDLFFMAAGSTNITGTEEVGIGSASTVFSVVDANGPNQSSIELAVTSTAPWKFDSPAGSGHVVMNANSGMNLTVDQKAGMEVVSYDGSANMNLYANDFNIHSLDSEDAPSASLEVTQQTTATWGFDQPDTDGHIVLSAAGGINLNVGGDEAGIEMAYNADMNQANMNLYAYEYFLYGGDVHMPPTGTLHAPTIEATRTTTAYVNWTTTGSLPATPENGTMIFNVLEGLMIFWDGGWYTFDLTLVE